MYSSVRKLESFGGLIAKAPLEHHRLVGNFIPALYTELDMFEAEAQYFGISLEGIEMVPTCHAYSMFLLATAHFDSWTHVKQQQTQSSLYQRLIDHWSGDAFAGAMQEVKHAVDKLAEVCGSAERSRMEEIFRLTMRYEHLFWDMVLPGED